MSNSLLSTLHPGGRPISKLKYGDLIELLKFIPDEYNLFYEEDFGLASVFSDSD